MYELLVYPRGTKVYLLPPTDRTYGDMCDPWENQDLITNIRVMMMVKGAKIIYFSRRIHIRNKIWLARTSARAPRAKSFGNSRKLPNFRIYSNVQTCAALAEVYARQKFFRVQIRCEK